MAVRIQGPDLAKIRKRLPSDKLARRVAVRSINRAMDAGRTAAVKEAAKDYVVRQRQIRDRMHYRRASESRLEASLTWRGSALNVADFKVTPGKPQPAKRPVIRVTIGRRSGAKPYHGAFLINTRAGIKAFRRTSSARKAGERYPITGVWGPSIPQILSAKSVRDAVESRATEVLSARIDHEINREINKLVKL